MTTTATRLPSESPERSKISETLENIFSSTQSKYDLAEVKISVEESASDVEGSRYVSIRDLVKGWEQDPDTYDAIAEGRKWTAEKLYSDSHNFRAIRLRCGYSQTKLAELAETSQPHIARIEKGNQDIRLTTLRKLASVLDVSLDELNEALLSESAESSS